jgi:hypothetical protein
MDAFAHAISDHLRTVALALPETFEGTSCVNRAFKARKKNFLFVGEKGDQVRVMLKLSDSLADAAALGDPRVGVGTTGWVTIVFAADDPPDGAMLDRWVVESFRTLAPRTVLWQLDAG